MKNKYIFFRTDRIGDFLLSAVLIKSIKRSDKNSFITVIASKKNYSYIKNFDFINEVILFPESYLSKITFYLSFILKKFYLIALLDGKKRSLYFSFLTRSKFKFLFTYKNFYKSFLSIFFTKIFHDKDSSSKISEIKQLLRFLNFDLAKIDFNTIDKSSVLLRNFNIPLSDKYTLLHFDEKWILNDYISTYRPIEPESEETLMNFIEKLVHKTKNDIFISTGNIPNKFTRFLKVKFFKKDNNIYEFTIFKNKVFFFDDISFLELEKLILSSNLLITCHGAATHVAASFNIKIIDIIDNSEKVFFNKWTSHIDNYKSLERNSFKSLTNKIINNC